MIITIFWLKTLLKQGIFARPCPGREVGEGEAHTHAAAGAPLEAGGGLDCPLDAPRWPTRPSDGPGPGFPPAYRHLSAGRCAGRAELGWPR